MPQPGDPLVNALVDKVHAVVGGANRDVRMRVLDALIAMSVTDDALVNAWLGKVNAILVDPQVTPDVRMRALRALKTRYHAEAHVKLGTLRSP